MKCWILMFRPETYAQVLEKGVIGVLNRDRKRFAALEPGDKFVVYVSRVREVDAHGEITSQSYVDASPTFPGWEKYPQRCTATFGRTGAHLPADDLLWGLSEFRQGLRTLPTNVLFCKGGFMEITHADFEHIRSRIDGA